MRPKRQERNKQIAWLFPVCCLNIGFGLGFFGVWAEGGCVVRGFLVVVVCCFLSDFSRE